MLDALDARTTPTNEPKSPPHEASPGAGRGADGKQRWIKAMICVPQGRRHSPVAQISHHNDRSVGAGYRICPVTKSTSMTSCRATNTAVTQSSSAVHPDLI